MDDGWTYWRLHDEAGHVVGFLRKRESDSETQYVGVRGNQWQREPIPFYDCFLLTDAPPGLHYLQEPE